MIGRRKVKFVMLSIFVFLSTLLFMHTVRASKPDELIIFDNLDYGGLSFGVEKNMVDYLVLAHGSNMTLPSAFTICSSVHLNFMTTSIFFYQLYQDNGMPWFSLVLVDQRDLIKFQEIAGNVKALFLDFGLKSC